MARVPRAFLIAVSVGGAALLLLTPPAVRSTPSERIVILAPSSLDLDAISTVELRNLWLGRTRAVGDRLLTPYTCEALVDVTAEFCEVVLKKSVRDLRRHYLSEALRGRFLEPRAVPAVEDLLASLARDSSGVTFMDRARFETLEAPEIKVLRVDGLDYRHPDYPLRSRTERTGAAPP